MNANSSLSRRQFIKLSAAGAGIAAVGLPMIIPSRVLGAQAPSKLINIGVIGCGRIAFEMDMPGVLKHHALARIVAVSDFDSNRAAKAKRHVEQSYQKSLKQKVDVKIHANYLDLIARKDIDAVMICTPDHWHAQPVVEAALAGKDIYVQKPLSMTLAEGRLVSDTVSAKKSILQIGSQQRSTEQFHRACELARNGVIGKVKTIQIGLPTDPAGGNKSEMPIPENLNYDGWLGCTAKEYYTEDRVHPQNDFGRPGWLRLNQHTCGMITGWGSHHVDISHWAMGTEYTGPIAVDATATWPGPESFWNVHGKYNVKLTYANGVVTTISDEFTNGLKIEGENGWIWVCRGSMAVTKSDPTAGQKVGKALNASDPKILQVPDSDLKIKLHKSPNWDHHLDWLEAMRERREAVTNAETGHRSCSGCNISWIGMKLGRPLKWDPEKEHFNDDEANAMMHRPERAPYGAFNAVKKAGFTQFKTL